jgi:hypothetical protein
MWSASQSPIPIYVDMTSPETTTAALFSKPSSEKNSMAESRSVTLIVAWSNPGGTHHGVTIIEHVKGPCRNRSLQAHPMHRFERSGMRYSRRFMSSRPIAIPIVGGSFEQITVSCLPSAALEINATPLNAIRDEPLCGERETRIAGKHDKGGERVWLTAAPASVRSRTYLPRPGALRTRVRAPASA